MLLTAAAACRHTVKCTAKEESLIFDILPSAIAEELAETLSYATKGRVSLLWKIPFCETLGWELAVCADANRAQLAALS